VEGVLYQYQTRTHGSAQLTDVNNIQISQYCLLKTHLSLMLMQHQLVKGLAAYINMIGILRCR
jgi:hypothetical protein